MSSTHAVNEHGTPVPTAAPVDLKLEVVPLPVADVDRAKRFYEGLGGASTPTSPVATSGGWCS